jgi:hypothetical protein
MRKEVRVWEFGVGRRLGEGHSRLYCTHRQIKFQIVKLEMTFKIPE